MLISGTFCVGDTFSAKEQTVITRVLAKWIYLGKENKKKGHRMRWRWYWEGGRKGGMEPGESSMDCNRGRALIIQQMCGQTIYSSSYFSFGASSKKKITVRLKQQSRMEENCILLFGETDRGSSWSYLLASSFSHSVFALRCQHLKQKTLVRLQR